MKKMFHTNPENIKISNYIINNSFSKYNPFFVDNRFTIFKSIYNILYLIYADKNNSIISYDILNNIKLIHIKKSHKEPILSFRHYFDKNAKCDFVLSLSGFESNIKLWNVNTWECLFNYEKVNINGCTFSACFLNSNSQNFIITSSYLYYHNLYDSDDMYEHIKVFDFKGNLITKINDSNEDTIFVDSYYDKNLLKIFIITGNNGYVKSYDFYANKLYHKYEQSNILDDNYGFNSIIINYKDNIIKLISIQLNGNILMWNFHSGELITNINISLNNLSGFCQWNDEYFFVGDIDEKIILLKLISGKFKIIKEFNHNDKVILTIKKIEHPILGECILSQHDNNKIILWSNIV